MNDALHLIDWGTTNARSYRVGPSGDVIDKRDTPLGIMNVADGNFTLAFDTLVQGWGTARALLSGMIGSRNGWVEAPYASCPASMDSLAQSVVAHPEYPHILFVPGLSTSNPAGRFDVMRGEEIQAFGALSQGGGEQLLCLPGTHSKWVSCHDDMILSFATSLTGEVFDLLQKHSILRLSMEPDMADAMDGDSFDRGVAASKVPGGLLDQLFGIRALDLSQEERPASMRDFLSGLLIGHEIGAMEAMFARGGDVTVIGAPALNTRYTRALQGFGMGVDSIASEEATLLGLIALSRRVTWPGL